MNRSRLLGGALVGGALVTLVTGLVPVRTLLGGTHYGLPVAWLVRRVLAPQYWPWHVEPFGLVVDVVVWSAAVLVVLVAYDRYRHGSVGGQPA